MSKVECDIILLVSGRHGLSICEEFLAAGYKTTVLRLSQRDQEVGFGPLSDSPFFSNEFSGLKKSLHRLILSGQHLDITDLSLNPVFYNPVRHQQVDLKKVLKAIHQTDFNNRLVYNQDPDPAFTSQQKQIYFTPQDLDQRWQELAALHKDLLIYHQVKEDEQPVSLSLTQERAGIELPNKSFEARVIASYVSHKSLRLFPDDAQNTASRYQSEHKWVREIFEIASKGALEHLPQSFWMVRDLELPLTNDNFLMGSQIDSKLVVWSYWPDAVLETSALVIDSLQVLLPGLKLKEKPAASTHFKLCSSNKAKFPSQFLIHLDESKFACRTIREQESMEISLLPLIQNKLKKRKTSPIVPIKVNEL